MVKAPRPGSRQEPRFDLDDSCDDEVAQDADAWRLSTHDRLAPHNNPYKNEYNPAARDEDARMAGAKRGGKGANRPPHTHMHQPTQRKKRLTRRKRSFFGFLFSTALSAGLSHPPQTNVSHHQ